MLILKPLCFLFVSSTDSTDVIVVYNSAPQIWDVLPAPAVVPRPHLLAPRGAVVRLTHELLTWRLSLHISSSPLSYPARQRRSRSSYLILVHALCCLCNRHNQPASYLLVCHVFLFFLPSTDTFIIPFQPLPWQLVSALWLTCPSPWVVPREERSAQRWRQVPELCNTKTTPVLCFLKKKSFL